VSTPKATTKYLFLEQKRKNNVIQKIKKNITNLDSKPDDLGFVTDLFIANLQNISQNI
jgi:hypothetical protein